MNKRLFLFLDIDGVLINERSQDSAWIPRWDAEIGKDLGINSSLLKEHFFKKHFESVLLGKVNLADALTETLQIANASISAKEVIDYWFQKDSHINYDLIDILKRLRARTALPTYLATNQEQLRANYIWSNLEFRNYFDNIYYSAQIGYTKSDISFFNHINKALNLNPTEDNILFFDDTPECIANAKQAGWNACLYHSLEDFIQHKNIATLLNASE